MPRTRVPSYPLAEVVRLAQTNGSRRITVVAEQTARFELGMDRSAVYAAVTALSARDFYKTMPSTRNRGLFQDVYRPVVHCPRFPLGVRVYCKVQIVRGLVVTSFKRL